MTSLLHDAMAHHIWANDRLLEVCATLTDEQLRTPVPGTFGPILGTFGHMIASDGWYLTFFREWDNPLAEERSVTIAELRAINRANGEAWMALLDTDLDADRDLPEEGDGWRFHAPAGLRLAQTIHHGTDHRSQVCSGLTALGIEPPEIDLWGWGRAAGRTQEEWLGEGPPPGAPAS